MLLSVKRVSLLLPEAKQSIPEKGSGCHRTTGDIPLHISLRNAAFGAPGRIRRRTFQILGTDGSGDQEQLERTEKGQG